MRRANRSASFQIGEGDVLAHHESFYLVELDLGARRDLLVAEAHPGSAIRIGGGFSGSIAANSRMAWICPGEVCVRSTIGLSPRSPASIKNVSCISPPGWFGGKFSNWKLTSSVSTSREVYTWKAHIRQDIQHTAQLLGGRMQPSHMDTAPGQRHVELSSSRDFARAAL